ncbi:MAG: hypothetical protein ACTH1W_08390 [Advenella sp.]|nr:hypothetical protein [Advenella sp. S44]
MSNKNEEGAMAEATGGSTSVDYLRIIDWKNRLEKLQRLSKT